jgi:peptidoglycan hydrolase-like protein with peptidoglycan-binding domain
MSQGKQSQGMPNEGMPGQQSKGKQSQTKQSQTKQSQTKQSQGKQGQAEQRGQGQRDQTTGQGQRGQRDQTQGQGQRGEPSPQQSETRQGQTPQQGQAQQGQAQQGTQGAGGSVTLNSQQRTRIQQTVLAGRNVPRVNNVNFALSVGTAVPSSVRVVEVPSALIEINPQWRGHQYFVVRDEIIIVDRSRKIVATVPVGSSGGAALHSRGGAASVAEVNLTEEQIRQVQIVLNEKGFNIGRPDGRLGPRTIRALTAFQRRQGLEVSGRLDSRTVAALGVSNVSGGQGGSQGAGQSSTTGQGGAGSKQAPAQQNQGARQPSTSGQSGGQGGAAQHQAPAQHKEGAKEPSTSGQNGGQGGAAQQHAPSQHNEGASKPSTSGQGSSQQTPAQRNPGSSTSQRPANEQHENAGSK